MTDLPAAEKRLDTCDATYAERQSVPNKGEELFEAWATANNKQFWRFGFDEKKGNIPNFYLIDPRLRSLPDYILNNFGAIIFVHVKGTNKLKVADLSLYADFESEYVVHRKNCHLRICFVMGEKSLFWFSIYDLIEITKDLEKKFYKDPGGVKEYWEIPLFE